MGFVYKITNTVNGKSYIGISIHEPEKQRIRNHLSGNGNRILSKAVEKYGRDAFVSEILEENVFPEFLPDLEIVYIAKFNTVAPHGYNLTTGGETAKEVSAETRQKLSEANKGRPSHMKGKTRSLRDRRKITEALRRTETREKMSDAQKGNTKWLGKKHSPETKRKISQAAKGNKAFSGKKHSPESLRKMSEARKQWWSNRNSSTDDSP